MCILCLGPVAREFSEGMRSLRSFAGKVNTYYVNPSYEQEGVVRRSEIIFSSVIPGKGARLSWGRGCGAVR